MEKLRDLKAAICEGGHLQKSTLENHENYEKKFCTECSSKIVDKCNSCNTPIIGGYISQKWVGGNYLTGENRYAEEKNSNTSIPNYCHECGSPYPWTKKFLDDYKLILDLQSEEIEAELSGKIYAATENALREKFEGNSLTILGLMYRKLSPSVQTVLTSVLSNVASTQIIEKIIQK